MSPRNFMKLGLSMRYVGYHAAAWRHPDADPGAASKFSHFLRVAQAAEAAKFDMVFLADGIGLRAKDEPAGSLARSAQNAELEPLTLLSALAPMTSHIGLVATQSTTYNEPFHIARKYASLDQISGGRAGWNIVTSWSDAEARNFNRDSHLDSETRYNRAAEFVDVVTGLWDSWDVDAFPHDKTSGLFFDPAKLHTLDHKGKHFQVRGPLTVARTPQGRPILVQAGASNQGIEIAARYADVVYSAAHEIESATRYYADLKGRLATYGRRPDQLLIMPGITPFVGRTEQEARDKYDQLNALVDPILGLSYLYGQMGDLSGYDVGRPGAGADQSAGPQHRQKSAGTGQARQSDHPPALYADRRRVRQPYPGRHAGADGGRDGGLGAGGCGRRLQHLPGGAAGRARRFRRPRPAGVAPPRAVPDRVRGHDFAAESGVGDACQPVCLIRQPGRRATRSISIRA